MNAWLLEIIKCPITGQKLRVADPALVESLVARQRTGELFSHKGIPIAEPFESGLVNESADYFYRVADDIPTLLADEAVALRG